MKTGSQQFLADLFTHSTEVRFASFLSGGFITDIVVNPTERKLTKRTSVHSGSNQGGRFCLPNRV